MAQVSAGCIVIFFSCHDHLKQFREPMLAIAKDLLVLFNIRYRLNHEPLCFLLHAVLIENMS